MPCSICTVLQDFSNSATSPLSQLHWLPVTKRITFKATTPAYQSTISQPTYLSSILTPHQPQQSLRSVNQNLSYMPYCSSRFGQRTFSYYAPKIWNDTPLMARQTPSLGSFKHNLKTHFFANNWPPGDCLQRLWFNIVDIGCFTYCYEWMDGWMDGWINEWMWNYSEYL